MKTQAYVEPQKISVYHKVFFPRIIWTDQDTYKILEITIINQITQQLKSYDPQEIKKQKAEIDELIQLLLQEQDIQAIILTALDTITNLPLSYNIILVSNTLEKVLGKLLAKLLENNKTLEDYVIRYDTTGRINIILAKHLDQETLHTIKITIEKT